MRYDAEAVSGAGAWIIQNPASANLLASENTWTAQQTFDAVTNMKSPLFINGPGTMAIELGRTDGVDSTPFIDFHSGETAIDRDARIIASGGDGSSNGGTLTFECVTLRHNSTNIDAFPSGTVMLFQQSAAPTGWTKQTTHNNKALRVVSGSVGSGGSVAFTTAFSSARAVSGTVSGTALTAAQLPPHVHGSGSLAAASAGAHTHPIQTVDEGLTGNAGNSIWFDESISGRRGPTDRPTKSAGTHTHSITGNTASAGSGQAHTHGAGTLSVNLDVHYVNIILAAKD